MNRMEKLQHRVFSDFRLSSSLLYTSFHFHAIGNPLSFYRTPYSFSIISLNPTEFSSLIYHTKIERIFNFYDFFCNTFFILRNHGLFLLFRMDLSDRFFPSEMSTLTKTFFFLDYLQSFHHDHRNQGHNQNLIIFITLWLRYHWVINKVD